MIHFDEPDRPYPARGRGTVTARTRPTVKRKVSMPVSRTMLQPLRMAFGTFRRRPLRFRGCSPDSESQ
jgi:hypothetical protein